MKFLSVVAVSKCQKAQDFSEKIGFNHLVFFSEEWMVPSIGMMYQAKFRWLLAEITHTGWDVKKVEVLKCYCRWWNSSSNWCNDNSWETHWFKHFQKYDFHACKYSIIFSEENCHAFKEQSHHVCEWHRLANAARNNRVIMCQVSFLQAWIVHSGYSHDAIQLMKIGSSFGKLEKKFPFFPIRFHRSYI